MPDKFRDTFPIDVVFVAGEQPTATKLTSWARQTNQGLEAIEYILGDPLSHSFPLFSLTPTATPVGFWGRAKAGGAGLGTEETHLQINQLARLIGPASALNPRILGLAERGNSSTNQRAVIVEETLPIRQGFFLNYIPQSGTVEWGNTTKFATSKTEWKDVKIPGDYWINYGNGRVVVQSIPFGSSTDWVSYEVDPTAKNMIDTYHGAAPNVYPHINQTVKCIVTGSAAPYTIELPTFTDQQGNWDEISSTLSAADDLNLTSGTVASTNANKYWFPSWLTGQFTTGNLGDPIPDGIISVWDEQEKQIVAGCIFSIPDNAWGAQNKVLVSGVELDTATANRYSLIVAGGTDITRTLDNLRTRFRHHTHSGTDGDRRIDHGILDGRYWGSVHTAHAQNPAGTLNTSDDPYYFVPQSDGETGNNDVWWREIPTWDPGYGTSPYSQPDGLYYVRSPKPFVRQHPQLLGRWGQDSSHTRNAMLGHLLMSTNHLIDDVSGPPPHFHSDYSSFGIQFSSENGPMIYFCNDTGTAEKDDTLRLRGRDVYIDNRLFVEDMDSTGSEFDGDVQINNNLQINDNLTVNGSITVDSNDSGGENFEFGGPRDTNFIVPIMNYVTPRDDGMNFGYGNAIWMLQPGYGSHFTPAVGTGYNPACTFTTPPSDWGVTDIPFLRIDNVHVSLTFELVILIPITFPEGFNMDNNGSIDLYIRNVNQVFNTPSNIAGLFRYMNYGTALSPVNPPSINDTGVFGMGMAVSSTTTPAFFGPGGSPFASISLDSKNTNWGYYYLFLQVPPSAVIDLDCIKVRGQTSAVMRSG